MWIITTGGFVSAVEHRDNKDLVMVRARDRQSLQTMIEGIELAGNAINAEGVKHEIEQDLVPVSSDTADYRWRVTVSKATFALWLQFEVLSYLNYPNFKSALAKHRGSDFSRAAHRVWDDMQLVSDGTQVYGQVGVGGKRIASKYSNYGSYGGSAYGGKGTYTGSAHYAGGGKKVGDSFFSSGMGSEDDKRDWENGYHGFNDHDEVIEDGINDADYVGEDVPELPEGADKWTDEEFEAWIEEQYPSAKPMALETDEGTVVVTVEGEVIEAGTEAYAALVAENDAKPERGEEWEYPRTFEMGMFESGIRGTQEEAEQDFDEILAEGTWGPLERVGDLVIEEIPQKNGTMYYMARAVVDRPKAVEPVLDFETAKKELEAITSKPTFQQKKSKYAAKKSDR
jgi:hypothetical protein